MHNPDLRTQPSELGFSSLNYAAVREPKMRFHRQRAHSNPFTDHNIVYPLSPAHFEVEKHFGTSAPVKILDIGCGYGGMLFRTSPLFDANILGMEIRSKLVDYVQLKIHARRSNTGGYQNISVVRTNAMKFCVNYAEKKGISKIFILFPDPHFKRKKHKARIVSKQMLDIYEYLLEERGRVYIATDVEELFGYMVDVFTKHPLFREVGDKEGDPLYGMLITETEESRKADSKGNPKFKTIFECVALDSKP